MDAPARHIPVPDGALRAGQHQFVALGPLAQGLLDPPALGDVAHRRQAASVGRPGRDRLAVGFDDDAAAVLAQDGVLDDALVAAPKHCGGAFALFGDDQFHEGPSCELTDRVARHARDLLVAVDDAAALADEDALEGGSGEQRQPLFALAQGLFVEDALADIAQDDGEAPVSRHLGLGDRGLHLKDLAIRPPAANAARAGKLAAAYAGPGESAHLLRVPAAGVLGQ